jgi:hypothetical protein
MVGRPATNAQFYEIRLMGHLGPRWGHQFEGLTITLEDDGNTLLSGPVADQAALHGLLRKVRDLGMPLVSVVQIQSDRLEKREKRIQAPPLQKRSR